MSYKIKAKQLISLRYKNKKINKKYKIKKIFVFNLSKKIIKIIAHFLFMNKIKFKIRHSSMILNLSNFGVLRTLILQHAQKIIILRKIRKLI